MLLERNRKSTNVFLLVDRGSSRSRGNENRQLRLGLFVVRGRGQPLTVLSLKRTFDVLIR